MLLFHGSVPSSCQAVRARLFCVALRAAIFRLRDDGVHAGATPVPASKTRLQRVSPAQQKLRDGPRLVPFGDVFDTRLSRLWNAAAIVLPDGKRIAAV